MYFLPRADVHTKCVDSQRTYIKTGLKAWPLASLWDENMTAVSDSSLPAEWDQGGGLCFHPSQNLNASRKKQMGQINPLVRNNPKAACREPLLQCTLRDEGVDRPQLTGWTCRWNHHGPCITRAATLFPLRMRDCHSHCTHKQWFEAQGSLSNWALIGLKSNRWHHTCRGVKYCKKFLVQNTYQDIHKTWLNPKQAYTKGYSSCQKRPMKSSLLKCRNSSQRCQADQGHGWEIS